MGYCIGLMKMRDHIDLTRMTLFLESPVLLRCCICDPCASFIPFPHASLFAYCATEDEMARTQKNKATEGHLGMLKARLAKLRSEVRRLTIAILLAVEWLGNSLVAAFGGCPTDDATHHWRRICWAWLRRRSLRRWTRGTHRLP